MSHLSSDAITPVILTFNEEANIGRTLSALQWARLVLVLDSGSTDMTEATCKSFPNVHWCVRDFDSHSSQWTHALRHEIINSPYVMALDADMRLLDSERFLAEFRERFLPGGYLGGVLSFQYFVMGQKLARSVYPPQLRLLSRKHFTVIQRGHTQEFCTPGPHYAFRQQAIHDDRKDLRRFVLSQLSYSRLEYEALARGEASGGRVATVLRKACLMPLVAFSAAYIASGGPLAGRGGIQYSLERAMYESLLALRILRGTVATPSGSDRL